MHIVSNLKKTRRKYAMGKKDTLIEKNNISVYGGCVKIKDDSIKVDNYFIESIIGNGANAVVLKGSGRICNDDVVAIKIWVPDSREDRNQQYEEELKKFSKLKEINSPYIINYYTSGVINGYYYCVMMYLDPQKYITLNEWLEIKRPFSTRYEILMNILSGLRKAQENHIFHGDLHTNNIMINPEDNSIKIIDFGTSFRNREYSKARDNKMTYNLGMSILDEEYNENLLVYYSIKLDELPQNAVRLIVKALAKIIVLLNHWESGDVYTVVKDIAMFATLVPFFNISLLIELLFTKRTVPDRYRQVFMNTILYELSQKIDIDSTFHGYMYKNIASKLCDIESLYKEAQMNFIKLCESKAEEKYIYSNWKQADLFNNDLFSKYVDGDSVAALDNEELLAIQSLIQ